MVSQIFDILVFTVNIYQQDVRAVKVCTICLLLFTCEYIDIYEVLLFAFHLNVPMAAPLEWSRVSIFVRS